MVPVEFDCRCFRILSLLNGHRVMDQGRINMSAVFDLADPRIAEKPGGRAFT